MANPRVGNESKTVIEPLPALESQRPRYPATEKHLTALLDVILKNVLQTIAADDAHIFLYDGERLGWGDKSQSRPIYSEPRSNGLTYTVARSAEMIVIPNVNEHPFYQNGGWGSTSGAILGLPLRSSKRVLGVLSIAFTQPHNFTEAELRRVEMLGDHAVLTIEKENLLVAEQKQRALAESLRETAETLSQSLDLHAVLDRILTSVQRIIPHEAAVIVLAEDDGRLAVAHHRGFEKRGLADWMSQWRYSMADFPIDQELAQRGTPLIIFDTRKSDFWVEIPEMDWVRSFMATPIRVRDKYVGAINLTSSAPHLFLPENNLPLQAFANQAAIAIENARLFEGLHTSETRFRNIFETANVSITEEDFSVAKSALDALKAEGLTDMRAYLTAHPEFVQQVVKMVRVNDVNTATVRIFGAASKEELLGGALSTVFVPETFDSFREELIAIAEGQSYFEGETVIRTLTGERRDLLLTTTLPPEAEDYRSVLVSLMDITERKQAEAASAELLRISAELNAPDMSVDKVLEIITETSNVIVHSRFTSLFAFEEETEKLVLIKSSGAPASYPAMISEGFSILSGEGPAGIAFQKQEPRLVEDLLNNTFFSNGGR